MLTKEQLYMLSEYIGCIDALAFMRGQTITITDTMVDMLCDMSTELTRMRDALSGEGEETPLPGGAVVIKELPFEVLEEKKPLTAEQKRLALRNWCDSQKDCGECTLFYSANNYSITSCCDFVDKVDEYFDILVRAGCLTPDGQVIEED